MMHRCPPGDRLVAVLTYLKDKPGGAPVSELAAACGLEVIEFHKRVRPWKDRGWIEPVEGLRAVYRLGWKAVGQRRYPKHGSSEAKLLSRCKVVGKLTLASARDALRSLDDQFVFKVIGRLVALKWLKRNPGGWYELAPDPFVSAEVLARVNAAIDRLKHKENRLGASDLG